MAMDRDGARFARKATHPIDALTAERDPFRLTLAGADLSDRGMAGAFEDVAWELSWEPSLPAAEHVDPLLRRAGIAKTILVLAHPDLAVSGTVRFADRELVLEGARGGQAHLWGSKHASRWTWAHANDLRSAGGRAAPGRLPRRRQRLRAALRAPAGAEHAGGRTLRRRRLPLDEPAERDPQLEPLRPDELALRGARRQAQGGRRGRRAARARSSA